MILDKNLPLVSVTIATYNQDKYIAETIESVLGQDYPNIEIIISDDCSSDSTPSIIKDFAENYPNKIIAIYNKRNLGISKNCNQALSYAQGKFVAPLGGDDIMMPTKISQQVKALLARPDAVICYHNVEVFQSDSNKFLYHFHDIKAGGHFPHTGYITEALLLYRCFLCNGCSFMILKDALPKKGYNINFSTASDWFLMIEVSLKGPALYIDHVLGRYRRHKDNITKKIVDCKQEEEIYEIIARDHPSLSYSVNKGRARLYLFYVIKYALSGYYKAAFRSLYNLGAIIIKHPYVVLFLLKSLLIDGRLQLVRFYTNKK